MLYMEMRQIYLYNNSSQSSSLWASYDFEKISSALDGMRQLVEVSSHNKKVVGLILGQGTYLGCRFDLRSHIPNMGTYGKQSIDACLLHQCFSISLPLSLPLSLQAMKKMSWGEDKK